MSGPGSEEEWFEVARSPESVTSSTESEPSNVCRVAALSTMWRASSARLDPFTSVLTELGFSPEVIAADRPQAQGDPFRRDPDNPLAPGRDLDRARLQRWRQLNETAQPRDMIAFLLAVLGSASERESAASACALWQAVAPRLADPDGTGADRWWRHLRLIGLWEDAALSAEVVPFPPLGAEDFDIADLYDIGGDDVDTNEAGSGGFGDPDGLGRRGRRGGDADVRWDPQQWQSLFSTATQFMDDDLDSVYLIGLLARWRLSRALRSQDPIVRQLAAAAFLPAGGDGRPEPPVAPRSTAPGALVVSTMIHGTWGWKGSWWRPGSGFHDHILRTHRPNLFSRGARYSWSGALSDRQRALAAQDFLDWSYDIAPHGVQTLFAHSYGGEVAARAIARGANVHELVLLSAPVTGHIARVLHNPVRIVDVRLRFDPVLWLAGTYQSIPAHPHVTAVVYSRWNLDHGATHDERAWQREDVARRGGL